jgi:hypothetical protein
MKGELCVLQIAKRQMILEQLANAVVRNQEIAAPEKSQQRLPGDRENVAAREPAPDGFKLENALQRRSAGIVGAVDGADAGTDHHVGGNAVGDERVQHADLDRAKAAAAGEDECGLRRIVLRRRGQGSSPQRVSTSPDQTRAILEKL